MGKTSELSYMIRMGEDIDEVKESNYNMSTILGRCLTEAPCVTVTFYICETYCNTIS